MHSGSPCGELVGQCGSAYKSPCPPPSCRVRHLGGIAQLVLATGKAQAWTSLNFILFSFNLSIALARLLSARQYTASYSCRTVMHLLSCKSPLPSEVGSSCQCSCFGVLWYLGCRDLHCKYDPSCLCPGKSLDTCDTSSYSYAASSIFRAIATLNIVLSCVQALACWQGPRCEGRHVGILPQ